MDPKKEERVEQLPVYRGKLKPTTWSEPKPKKSKRRTRPEFVQKRLL